MAKRSILRGDPAADESSVSVLDKGFDLLDALGEGRDASASELAAQVGQPRSSVYRLLTKLRDRGWVEPGASRGTFRLGLEVLRLAEVVRARLDVRESAAPAMERIHQERDETVYLCVRSQDKSVCVERIDGMFVGRAFLDVGGALPLHVGATSQVLLAFEPESEWERYVTDTELSKFTPKTVSDRQGLFAKLKEIRANGYAISDEDVTLGLGAVGTPIFDHQGKIVAAISVGGVRQSVLGDDLAGVVKLMKACANQASLALGYRADRSPASGSDSKESN